MRLNRVKLTQLLDELYFEVFLKIVLKAFPVQGSISVLKTPYKKYSERQGCKINDIKPGQINSALG